MLITLIRILCFLLVPAGGYLLYFAIRMLRKTFAGRIIAEMPFSQQEMVFDIPEAGTYAVWLSGTLFSRSPVDKFELALTDHVSGVPVARAPSVLRPHVNGFDSARIEYLRFSAGPGRYRMTATEKAGKSWLERAVPLIAGTNKADDKNHSLQIRESQPVYFMLLSVFLLIVSLAGIIGGLVLGFAGPQLLQGSWLS